MGLPCTTSSPTHTPWLPLPVALPPKPQPIVQDTPHLTPNPNRLDHSPAVLPICMSGKFVNTNNTAAGMASIMRYSVSNLAPTSSKLW